MTFHSSNLKFMPYDSDKDTALTNFCLVPETFFLLMQRFRFGFSTHAGFSSCLLWFPASMSLSFAFVPGGNTAIQELTLHSEGFKHTLFFQRAPPNLLQCRNILVNNMTPLDCLGVRFFASYLLFILRLFVLIQKCAKCFKLFPLHS